MARDLELNTIAGEDVLATITEMENSDDYTESQMEAVYTFASELMGVSTDTLSELMTKED